VTFKRAFIILLFIIVVLVLIKSVSADSMSANFAADVAFGESSVESGAWEDAWNNAENPTTSWDFNDSTNYRQIVDSGEMESAGPWTKIRINYKSCQAVVLTAAVCIADGINPGDCVTTPVQITWNTGQTSWTTSGDETITSDHIDFSFSASDTVIFLTYEPAGADCYISGTSSGIDNRYDESGLGDETLVEDVGYSTTDGTGYLSWYMSVEGWNPD
jgi:hypothetical protein